MNKFVIVAEIQNLCINTDVSMSIEGQIKDYYIYSNHFIQKLNELNKTIIKIKQNELSNSYSMNINEIIKVLISSTFIIFEQELDLSMNSKELLNTIENLLSPLINLFSLFLRNFFSINRIYIFSKLIFGYEFCRLIDVYNPNKEISDEPQLIQILYVDGVETVFPWLLYRIIRKKEFIALISEYLTGRLKAPNNEMKFMLYWNALEHFTHFFWKNKQKLKLISKTNLKEINTCIREKIDLLNQEDILFPNITPKEIIKKGYLKVSSIPPIREQVFSLIERIRMDKSLKNVKDLINKVYYIRNKLFHANFYLEDIIESFRDQFNCPEFNVDDFVNIIKDYELNNYIYDKNELLSKGKYSILMKFISRFNQRIKNYT